MNFSDEELIVMFAAGTAEAFDMLYERYRHRIYGFACAGLGSAADAEEAVQEVFLRVARSAGAYQPRDRFKSWIFQIAANQIRDIVTRERFRRITHQYPSESLRMTDNDDRSSQMRRLEAMDQLEKVLGSLEPGERIMLVLKEIEGMSVSSVAEIMGLTPENVRVKLHRVRKRLKTVPLEQGGEYHE